MPLPDPIPVKYTEEEAEFLSIRPVVRQTFRIHELLDMVLSVTGKDAERIRKILQSGTVVFHFFRYRWEGFAAEPAELAAALGQFPDADPSRPFAISACTAVLLETGSQTPPEWKKEDAESRRWLRRKTFWKYLTEITATEPPAYASYSYERKGDVYALPMDGGRAEAIAQAASTLLPAAQRGPAASLPKARRLLFLCPRH